MGSRLGEYRRIRYNRTYRPLGRMTLWRVLLGIALLIYVFLLSGAVSLRLANAGHFKAAEMLMVSKSWIEKYRPEVKEYVEAGVLYQEGDYEAAAERFEQIENLAAADAMHSDSLVMLAAAKIAQGDSDTAFDVLTQVDANLISEERLLEYRDICAELLDYYSVQNGEEALSRVQVLQELLPAA